MAEQPTTRASMRFTDLRSLVRYEKSAGSKGITNKLGITVFENGKIRFNNFGNDSDNKDNYTYSGVSIYMQEFLTAIEIFTAYKKKTLDNFEIPEDFNIDTTTVSVNRNEEKVGKIVLSVKDGRSVLAVISDDAQVLYPFGTINKGSVSVKIDGEVKKLSESLLGVMYLGSYLDQAKEAILRALSSLDFKVQEIGDSGPTGKVKEIMDQKEESVIVNDEDIPY